jgi:WD40 repeat protein
VAFSPDGKRIVSGSADNTVRIWDALSGAEVLPPLRGHDNTISSVSFSPDSTRIVSGSHDNSIRVWDAVSGAVVLPPLQGHQDSIISVVFSPDGAHIISRSKLQNLIWDGATGHPYVWDGTHDEHSHALHGINTLALNPDGWIVDFAANQTVSKLPAMISPWCSATFDKTVAIGTQGGHVVILHFPPTMFNSPETRPAETPSED